MKIQAVLVMISCFIGVLAFADLDQDLQSHYERQRFDDAISLLEAHLDKEPGDLNRRVELGNVLDHLGRTDDALQVLRDGIKETPEDAELWWYISGIAVQLGNDGPTVTRSGGTVQYSPQTLSDEETKNWKDAKYDIAINAYEKILVYKEDHEDSAEGLAQVLVSRGIDKSSSDRLAQLAEQFGENDVISLAYAGAITEAGDPKEAEELLLEILERQPRNVASYRALADVQEELGQSKQAAESRKCADFYEWMPPFSTLVYSEELGVIPAEAEDSPSVVADRFKAINSKESSEILAAICFRHIAHGEIENGCFRELEARGEGALLVSLIQNGSSVCTLRESGASLARMKHPDAYDLLAAMLPRDTRIGWYINAAGSLDLLGDDRAIPSLIKVLDPEFKEVERQRSELDSNFMGNGPLHARRRAALALGGFDTPESRAALISGAENPDVADACNLALYRITKAKNHLEGLSEKLAEDSYAVGQFPDEYLRIINTEETVAIANEFDLQLQRKMDEQNNAVGGIRKLGKKNESE